MRVAVIVNPISGGPRAGGGPARLALARRVLDDLGVDGDVRMTEGAGHGATLARAAVADGASLVCAWGGDGTINEVASALARGPAALGVVPAGSGNGLARALGVPFDPARAIAHACRAPERRVDLGEIEGRLFVNVAGTGIDARVAWRYSRSTSARRGLLPYIVFGVREGLTARGQEYEITSDVRSRRCRAALVALANSCQYGSGARIAPLACLDDGRLDLVIVEHRSPLRLAFDVRRLFDGSLHRARGVTIEQVTRVTIASDAPMPFHVDGEAHQGPATLRAHVRPGALRIRA
jgi:YegS/Rv2252/BmrU family lipid kinase